MFRASGVVKTNQTNHIKKNFFHSFSNFSFPKPFNCVALGIYSRGYHLAGGFYTKVQEKHSDWQVRVPFHKSGTAAFAGDC